MRNEHSNKNMKTGIYTGGTSVRSKNIFTDISGYPTGNHEIMTQYLPMYMAVFFFLQLSSTYVVKKGYRGAFPTPCITIPKKRM